MRFPMFLAALAVGTSLSMAAVDPAYASYYENLPFEMPEVPTPAIPERTVELTDFGAVCDGVPSIPKYLPRLSTICPLSEAALSMCPTGCG